ncbi:hypothetical protein F4820DRAFT_467863 [Hypoxylon rubiginosum]|uniref:Uncharacterized protein n=1 Tax=Hypoxylon rubiginosum TaxID=110542 RepID=A0ACB9Z8L0_9PEZI|nr:hypothetical protein F4820DRAFT_467863 [Hypoxylon rubiginosum]
MKILVSYDAEAWVRVLVGHYFRAYCHRMVEIARAIPIYTANGGLSLASYSKTYCYRMEQGARIRMMQKKESYTAQRFAVALRVESHIHPIGPAPWTTRASPGLAPPGCSKACTSGVRRGLYLGGVWRGLHLGEDPRSYDTAKQAKMADAWNDTKRREWPSWSLICRSSTSDRIGGLTARPTQTTRLLYSRVRTNRAQPPHYGGGVELSQPTLGVGARCTHSDGG